MIPINAIKWIHASEAGMRSDRAAWSESWNDYGNGWTEYLVLNDSATPKDLEPLYRRYEALREHYPNLTLTPIPESITARIPGLSDAHQ